MMLTLKSDKSARLDVYISENSDVTRSYAGKLIERGLCKINGITATKNGEKLKAGDVIGGVGATDETEIAQEPHLHFELIKDGKSVNPLNYISGAEMY